MDAGGVAQIIGTGLAGAFGVVGVAMSAVALTRSKTANSAADKANALSADANTIAGRAEGVARDAVSQAERANELAGEANAVAREANTLAGNANALQAAQDARETERWHVDWSIAWDYEAGEFVARNVGSDAAAHAVIVIYGQDLHHVEQVAQIDAGATVRFPIQAIVDLRNAQALRDHRTVQSLAGSGVFYAPSGYSDTASVTIQWLTGLGAQKAWKGDVRLQ